jgi:hypothetical protein
MQQQNLRHGIVVKAKTFPSTIVNRKVSRRGRVVKRQNVSVLLESKSSARRQSNVSANGIHLAELPKTKRKKEKL